MSGPKDKVSSTDHVDADLPTEVTPPEHPCPVCGKAMKDANTDESKEAGKDLRICSSRPCRAKADWSSGTGVLLNN
jgi:hypothetical protein